MIGRETLAASPPTTRRSLKGTLLTPIRLCRTTAFIPAQCIGRTIARRCHTNGVNLAWRPASPTRVPRDFLAVTGIFGLLAAENSDWRPSLSRRERALQAHRQCPCRAHMGRSASGTSGISQEKPRHSWSSQAKASKKAGKIAGNDTAAWPTGSADAQPAHGAAIRLERCASEACLRRSARPREPPSEIVEGGP